MDLGSQNPENFRPPPAAEKKIGGFDYKSIDFRDLGGGRPDFEGGHPVFEGGRAVFGGGHPVFGGGRPVLEGVIQFLEVVI